MLEILYALFWMLIGAAATHLYHNANFKKAMAEELDKAKSSMNEVRTNVKNRL